MLKGRVRPKDDDELWEWIRDVLGFRIPRTVTAEGHTPPFEFISDFFFDRVDLGLVWANRTSGKTLGVFILHLLNTYFKEKFDILHIAGTEDQARQGYKYYAGDPAKDATVGFIRKDPFNEFLASEPMISKTALTNGSKIEIRTGGSDRSVSGPHPNFLSVDEMDHIEPGVLSTAFQGPVSRHVYRIQILMGSSQYNYSGSLQLMLDQAKERGTKVYKYDLFDVLENCGHKYPQECHNCPFFIWTNPFTGAEEELCKGRGSQADGWYTYRDALVKLDNTLSLETFALQNLLISGTSLGLVYSTFNYDKHVEPFPPRGADISQWKFFAGADVRGSGRIVVLAEAPEVLPSGKHMRWVVDEWADDNSTPSRVIGAAYEMKARIFEKYDQSIDVFWIELPSADFASDWQRAGLPGKTIDKEYKNVRYRIGQIRDALLDASGNISLKIDPRCETLIYAMQKGYMCQRKPDNTFDRDKPNDKAWSHSPDALGYGYIGGPVKNVSRRLPVHEKKSGWWDTGASRSKWAPY